MISTGIALYEKININNNKNKSVNNLFHFEITAAFFNQNIIDEIV